MANAGRIWSDDELRAIGAASDFLPKPFTGALLAARVRALLDARP